MLSRRSFLRASSLLALAPTAPLFVARAAGAAVAGKEKRALVVIQLDGGNDALNTVVPHADPAYRKHRPALGLKAKGLIKLTGELGLHPALKPLDKLLEAGELAVVPGVGYPNPSRSHFQSMAVWHTARRDPSEHTGYGWLGRALDRSASPSYTIGEAVPGALRGRRSAAVALRRADDFLLASAGEAKQAVGPETTDDLLAFVRRQAIDAHATAAALAKLAKDDGGARYPQTGLAERLKLTARLLKAGIGARVFYAIQRGYDTHATQLFAHAALLGELAGAVAAFFADLKESKLADRVALLTFSEFGRTIRENGSAGTDHGTAGVMFVAGPPVKGGVLGAMPSLTDLDRGEPKMTTDFRAVYAAALRDWLGIAPDGPLGAKIKAAELFAKKG
jgi:uncharacterized protein (DUF1501 family)